MQISEELVRELLEAYCQSSSWSTTDHDLVDKVVVGLDAPDPLHVWNVSDKAFAASDRVLWVEHQDVIYRDGHATLQWKARIEDMDDCAMASSPEDLLESLAEMVSSR